MFNFIRVWLLAKVFSRKERVVVLQKALLVSCIVLSLTCFFSNMLVDSYYLENRPRQVRPAEGRVHPKFIKVSYGATVYLTKRENLLSDLLIPSFVAIFVIGYILNARWKHFEPYKESR